MMSNSTFPSCDIWPDFRWGALNYDGASEQSTLFLRCSSVRRDVVKRCTASGLLLANITTLSGTKKSGTTMKFC